MPSSAFAGPAGDLVDAGAGMHATRTTASMLATATISRQSVTCGVGPVGLESPLPLLPSTTGVFAMMMYSVSVSRYHVDRGAATLTAKGRMRSITQVGGQVIEDLMHDYLAIGIDGRDSAPDRFSVHFYSPFWDADTNPMATRSDAVDGWSMFGGQILVGAVNVGR